MKRPLVFLALLVVALGAWKRGLTGAAERTRSERNRVGRLLTAEEREGLQMAAVRVRTREGDFLYARVEGLWRCLGYHQAPAHAQALQALVDKLMQAEGIVQTDVVEDAPEYGINTGETIQVELCGPRVLEDPGGDVLVAFDVGKRIPGREGSFVRRRGTKEIWAIDADPLAELERRPAPGLPPLLEPGVVPSAWSGWRSGLAQVFVDLVDGTSYQLEKRMVEIDPSELEPGQLPWVWTFVGAGGEHPSPQEPTFGYSLFLQRAPYDAVLDRERHAELVLERPHHTLTLAAPEGEPLQVMIGPPLREGGAPVWVPTTATLYRVPREVVPLLAPDPKLFDEGAGQNPWDPYLR